MASKKEPRKTPKRPKNVPANAVYDPVWKEWGAGELRDGKKEGAWKFWREDGTFVEESSWRNDLAHDKEKKRYHDDGSLASVACWDNGVMLAVRQFRTKKKTREPNLQSVPAKNVREAEFRNRGDGWQYLQIFRDDKGREVDFNGKPVPKRAPQIPDEAYFNSDIGLWVAGDWRARSQGGDAQRRRVYRYWDPKGVLVRVEYYDAKGECHDILDARGDEDNRPSGNPLLAAARARDAVSIEALIALGAAALPNAALQAAYEGFPELALRIASLPKKRPAITDARKTPDRRGAVAADAVWVGGLDRWVRGAYDATTGRASGTWDLWDAPAGYTYVIHEQVDFEDGRRVAMRRFNGYDEPAHWITYDREGREIKSRWIEASGIAEKETRADGALVRRELYENGTPSLESVTHEGKSKTKLFYEGGTLKAEGQRAVDEDGDLGDLIGVWRFYEPDGSLALEVDMKSKAGRAFAELSAEDAADVARMSKLRTWVSKEAAKVSWTKMTDRDDCNWYAFGEIAGHVGWLLEGMNSGVPDLQASACGSIFSDTWHQSSIYESSANLTPILLRLLREPKSNKEDVFELLQHYARSLRGSLPYLKKGAKDPTTRWLRKMHAAFVDERDELLELARSKDAKVRDGALALLATNVFGDDLWPEVWKLFVAEKDSRRRAQLALALQPHAQSPASLRDLERALETAKDDAVRFGLAMTLVQAAARLKKPAPHAGVATLVAFGKQPTTALEAAYEELAGEDAEGPVAANIGATLGHSLRTLNERLLVAAQLVAPISEMMIAEKSIEAFHYVGALLALTQPHDEREGKSPELRSLRKSVLEAIVKLPDKWWEWVNFTEVLDSFGVPHAHDPNEGRRLVRELAGRRAPWQLSASPRT